MKHAIVDTASYQLTATVVGTDKHTNEVHVKFTRNEGRGTHEMIITPDQLEDLGLFLMEQAVEIRDEQIRREVDV